MPITDITWNAEDDTLEGGPAIVAAQIAAAALGVSFIGVIPCAQYDGTLPNESLAVGSAYPGAHWKRWDGTVAAGLPSLGVDDGILENCLANYAPILYGVPFSRRLCVYVGLDGIYYVAGNSGDDIGGASLNSFLNSSVELALALPYENCS